MTKSNIELPRIVSRAEWLVARKDLLAKEKELTRHRDSVNATRRRLPMVRIDKEYVFDSPGGKVRLHDLFEGRCQLTVYHFMFDPTWDEGCPSCSFLVDNIGHLAHLHARKTSLALVSRAPLTKIEPYRKRMGWTIPWYSSFGSDFNYDFHVTMDEGVAPVEYNYRDKAELLHRGESYFTQGESHGLSVFVRDGGSIFHTYSTYARGGDLLLGTYNYLDLTPLGRQEDWEDPPGRSDGPFMAWVRRHDEYDDGERSEPCCGSETHQDGRAFGQAGPAIEPFTFHAPQSALDDLAQRLGRTRWPERETVADWSQGVPLAKLRALVEYWRTGYDWRRCEAKLNGFAQYRTEIDGLSIHFLHVRSPHANALPIVITHGWPGSVIEFFKSIDPLTNPMAHGGRAEDAFHVVAPSLPGFAFSNKPAERGWNAARIARAWAELMRRLGYPRYVAQGGDWGSLVTTTLAQQRAVGLAGIHLNMPIVFPDPIPTAGLSPAEQRAVDGFRRFQTDGFGYFLQQSTRPQTIGYALADSPAGQAAWIYEKFHAWTDNNGDPESALTRDEMLDNITLYWLTDTAASSARIYFEHAGIANKNNSGVVDLPVGCSIFPREIVPAPRRWAERLFPNLIHWNELDRGGHFAAFEQPVLFTKELRDCFRSLR